MRTRTSLCIGLLISMFACTDEGDLYQEGDLNVEVKTSTYLEFSSKSELEQTLADLRQGGNLSEKKDFISFFDSKKELLKSGTVEDDTLILFPDESIAKLVNEDGEVKVGNVVYKVTPSGTYYTNEEFKAEMDSYITSIESETPEKLSENVNYINTFERTIDFEVMPPDEGGSGGGGSSSGGSNGSSSSDNPYASSFDKSTTTVVEYNDLSITKFSAKTLVGGLIESVIGRNVEHGRYWGDNRRNKTNLYDYDYGFTASTGIYCKFQKKNWIGWSGTDSPNIAVGWSKMILKQKFGIYTDPNWVNSLPTTVHTKSLFGNVPGLEQTCKLYIISGRTSVISSAMSDVEAIKQQSSPVTEFDLFNIFSKYAKVNYPFSYSNPANGIIRDSKLEDVSALIVQDWEKGEAILIYSQYEKLASNVESVNINFFHDTGFKIGTDIHTDFETYFEIDRPDFPSPKAKDYIELVHADGYGVSYFDGRWKGYKVIKD